MNPKLTAVAFYFCTVCIMLGCRDTISEQERINSSPFLRDGSGNSLEAASAGPVWAGAFDEDSPQNTDLIVHHVYDDFDSDMVDLASQDGEKLVAIDIEFRTARNIEDAWAISERLAVLIDVAGTDQQQSSIELDPFSSSINSLPLSSRGLFTANVDNARLLFALPVPSNTASLGISYEERVLATKLQFGAGPLTKRW